MVAATKKFVRAAIIFDGVLRTPPYGSATPAKLKIQNLIEGMQSPRQAECAQKQERNKERDLFKKIFIISFSLIWAF